MEGFSKERENNKRVSGRRGAALLASALAVAAVDSENSVAEAATHPVHQPQTVERANSGEGRLDVGAIMSALDRGQSPIIDESRVAEVSDGVEVASAEELSSSEAIAVMGVVGAYITPSIETIENGEGGFSSDTTRAEAREAILTFLEDNVPEKMEGELRPHIEGALDELLSKSSLPEGAGAKEPYWKAERDWSDFENVDDTGERHFVAELALGNHNQDPHPDAYIRELANQVLQDPTHTATYENLLSAIKEYAAEN